VDSEITVVGAGIVGSSLACLLSNQGIKVTLLDHGSPLSLSKNSISQDRTLALNLSSIYLLKELNIWNELKKQNLEQTINTLAMASPFSLEEKQTLLETKNLNLRKEKLEEILKTYIFDNFYNNTLQ